jgi:hypothetical protein
VLRLLARTVDGCPGASDAQIVPVVHVEGREVKVLTAFLPRSIHQSSRQLLGFCLDFIKPPVPRGANQHLLPAATLTGGTEMVFHAAF